MKTNYSSESLLLDPEIVLIGGGIMSATLGTMLKQLNPGLSIQILESLPQVAQESSHAWNNAGTGHAALCELNYTPEVSDGSIDISKAIRITQLFETSKHFWGYLVKLGIIADPTTFIHKCPHMSFVMGAANQSFLKKRHAAMTESHFFQSMEYTTDQATIEQWAPLLNQGRSRTETVAATRVEAGTDVDFGELTHQMIDHLISLDGIELALNTKVKQINRNRDGRWNIILNGGQSITTKFVFIGAGGGALPLMQNSNIPEGKGYGGFPVSGLFLLCKNDEIIENHGAKVYGLAAVGAPPMSVPHLDSRIIGGEKSLLFGPYPGFSPKYLKSGSNLDLVSSLRFDNILPMLATGRDNIPLTSYLIQEGFQSHANRCQSLKDYFPGAHNDDWELIAAGQRVQIIKPDPQTTGKLQFGTEVVAAADGSLATVLGASPGASTATTIILEVLKKCFPTEMASEEWNQQLEKMVPAYGLDLAQDIEAYTELGSEANDLLRI
jgi:malate dehydrogenase (quinone)